MNILKVKNLTKKFDESNILDNVSIDCKTNEITSIFGGNGTGKSTLLQIIFGSIKADKCEIIINNIKFNQKNIFRHLKIGYLPQNSFLPKSLKVSDIIQLFLQNGEKQNIVFYSPNIYKIQDKKIGNLSIGELRYLEFLLISNLEHSFLLLDEPFSMIEPLYIEIIMDRLRGLKKVKGIILTDHYFNDVLNITDKSYLIKDGKLIKVKDKTDLIMFKYLNS